MRVCAVLVGNEVAEGRLRLFFFPFSFSCAVFYLKGVSNVLALPPLCSCSSSRVFFLSLALQLYAFCNSKERVPSTEVLSTGFLPLHSHLYAVGAYSGLLRHVGEDL